MRKIKRECVKDPVMSQTFRNAEMVLIEAPTLYHEQEEHEEDEMVHALQMPRSTR